MLDFAKLLHDSCLYGQRPNVMNFLFLYKTYLIVLQMSYLRLACHNEFESGHMIENMVHLLLMEFLQHEFDLREQ